MYVCAPNRITGGLFTVVQASRTNRLEPSGLSERLAMYIRSPVDSRSEASALGPRYQRLYRGLGGCNRSSAEPLEKLGHE